MVLARQHQARPHITVPVSASVQRASDDPYLAIPHPYYPPVTTGVC